MERRLSVVVAGQSRLLRVRNVGADAFEVIVDDETALQVSRKDSGDNQGDSRWAWMESGAVIKATVDRLGSDLHVTLNGFEVLAKVQDARRAVVAGLSVDNARSVSGPFHLRTQIAGRVVKVLVAVGDIVKEGQPLVVVEAMKMENEMRAPRDGVVAEISALVGNTVESGTGLLVLGAMP